MTLESLSFPQAGALDWESASARSRPHCCSPPCRGFPPIGVVRHARATTNVEPVTAGFVAATPQVSDAPQIEGPREETHQVHRNVVGVWDEETQSVYILEMDQNARKVVPFSANF